MTARAIDPAASAASPMLRRWRVVLGALLLTLAPSLASADEAEEWPTTPDRGPGEVTRIPWMRFSGDPNQPVEVLGQLGRVERGQEVLVVREKEPSRREKRLLRRAKRHAEKAARLRAKAGPNETYRTVVVPVVQPVGVVQPRTVVIDRGQPQVHVVNLADGDDSCQKDKRRGHGSGHAHGHGHGPGHPPVVIDAERISRDVERQVERALRDAERAQRGQERAEREAERAQREAERAGERGRRRGEAAAREVERAMRDGKIDREEGRRIGEAARGG